MKYMKTPPPTNYEEDEDPLQVVVDRKASCKTWCFPAHRDPLDELEVEDPIQKYNHRPER